jgi:hypothetical protein
MQAETFSDVFESLHRESVRYVAVGGFAVVMHGHDRPTTDLDIVVDPAPAEAERCVRALASAKFMPSVPLPLQFLIVQRFFDPSSREVDIFVRYPIPFAELWSSSQLVPVRNQTARIASLDHVLSAARIHGRPNDLADIEALTRTESP